MIFVFCFCFETDVDPRSMDFDEESLSIAYFSHCSYFRRIGSGNTSKARRLTACGRGRRSDSDAARVGQFLAEFWLYALGQKLKHFPGVERDTFRTFIPFGNGKRK